MAKRRYKAPAYWGATPTPTKTAKRTRTEIGQTTPSSAAGQAQKAAALHTISHGGAVSSVYSGGGTRASGAAVASSGISAAEKARREQEKVYKAQMKVIRKRESQLKQAKTKAEKRKAKKKLDTAIKLQTTPKPPKPKAEVLFKGKDAVIDKGAVGAVVKGATKALADVAVAADEAEKQGKRDLSYGRKKYKRQKAKIDKSAPAVPAVGVSEPSKKRKQKVRKGLVKEYAGERREKITARQDFKGHRDRGREALATVMPSYLRKQRDQYFAYMVAKKEKEVGRPLRESEGAEIAKTVDKEWGKSMTKRRFRQAKVIGAVPEQGKWFKEQARYVRDEGKTKHQRKVAKKALREFDNYRGRRGTLEFGRNEKGEKVVSAETERERYDRRLRGEATRKMKHLRESSLGGTWQNLKNEVTGLPDAAAQLALTGFELVKGTGRDTHILADKLAEQVGADLGDPKGYEHTRSKEMVNQIKNEDPFYALISGALEGENLKDLYFGEFAEKAQNAPGTSVLTPVAGVGAAWNAAKFGKYGAQARLADVARPSRTVDSRPRSRTFQGKSRWDRLKEVKGKQKRSRTKAEKARDASRQKAKDAGESPRKNAPQYFKEPSYGAGDRQFYARSKLVRGPQKAREQFQALRGKDPFNPTGKQATKISNRRALRTARRQKAGGMRLEADAVTRMGKLERGSSKAGRFSGKELGLAATFALHYDGTVQRGTEIADVEAVATRLRKEIRVADSQQVAQLEALSKNPKNSKEARQEMEQAHSVVQEGRRARMNALEELASDAKRNGSKSALLSEKVAKDAAEARKIGRALEDGLIRAGYVGAETAARRREIAREIQQGKVEYREKGQTLPGGGEASAGLTAIAKQIDEVRAAERQLDRSYQARKEHSKPDAFKYENDTQVGKMRGQIKKAEARIAKIDEELGELSKAAADNPAMESVRIARANVVMELKAARAAKDSALISRLEKDLRGLDDKLRQPESSPKAAALNAERGDKLAYKKGLREQIAKAAKNQDSQPALLAAAEAAIKEGVGRRKRAQAELDRMIAKGEAEGLNLGAVKVARANEATARKRVFDAKSETRKRVEGETTRKAPTRDLPGGKQTEASRAADITHARQAAAGMSVQARKMENELKVEAKRGAPTVEQDGWYWVDWQDKGVQNALFSRYKGDGDAPEGEMLDLAAVRAEKGPIDADISGDLPNELKGASEMLGRDYDRFGVVTASSRARSRLLNSVRMKAALMAVSPVHGTFLPDRAGKMVAELNKSPDGMKYTMVPVGRGGKLDPEEMRKASESGVNELVRKPRPGERVYIVPETIVEMYNKMYETPGRARAAVDLVNQKFVSATLPFSTNWHVGNVIDLTTRLLVSGVNPFDDPARARLLKKRITEYAGPEKAAEIMEELKGHYGSRQDVVRSTGVERALQSAHSETMRTFGRVWGKAFEKPVLKYGVGTPRHAAQKGFDLGTAVESVFVNPAMGRAAKTLAEDVGLEIGNLTRLAERLVDEPGLLDEFARRTTEMIGDYSQSPFMKATFGTVDPFWTWTREAVKFTMFTLPAKHPIKLALGLQLASLQADAAERLGYPKFEGPGGFLKGAFNVGGGYYRPVSPYSTMGETAKLFDDPASYVFGKPFPWLQGPIAIAGGYQTPGGRAGPLVMNKIQNSVGFKIPGFDPPKMAYDGYKPAGIAGALIKAFMPGANEFERIGVAGYPASDSNLFNMRAMKGMEVPWWEGLMPFGKVSGFENREYGSEDSVAKPERSGEEKREDRKKGRAPANGTVMYGKSNQKLVFRNGEWQKASSDTEIKRKGRGDETGQGSMAARRQATKKLARKYPELTATSPDAIGAIAGGSREYNVPPEILASIYGIETDFGRTELEGNKSGENYAGAGGPMQFLQATWDAYGADGNGDGKKDRYSVVDAIHGAANYLQASGAETDIRKAIFAYNHADWYVDEVIEGAANYVDPGWRDAGTGASVEVSKAKKLAGAWGGSRRAVLRAIPRGARFEAKSDKRTPGENASVGGSSTSDHLTTNALAYAGDISPDQGVYAKIRKRLGLGPATSGSDTVVKDGYQYQLILGAEYGHGDHIHLGAKWTGAENELPSGTFAGGPTEAIIPGGSTGVRGVVDGGGQGGAVLSQQEATGRRWRQERADALRASLAMALISGEMDMQEFIRRLVEVQRSPEMM